jgi:hypothetical protein
VNTKKDFIRAANLCRKYSLPHRRTACEVFVDFFKESNPHFDVEEFYVTCNVKEGSLYRKARV